MMMTAFVNRTHLGGSLDALGVVNIRLVHIASEARLVEVLWG